MCEKSDNKDLDMALTMLQYELDLSKEIIGFFSLRCEECPIFNDNQSCSENPENSKTCYKEIKTYLLSKRLFEALNKDNNK